MNTIERFNKVFRVKTIARMLAQTDYIILCTFHQFIIAMDLDATSDDYAEEMHEVMDEIGFALGGYVAVNEYGDVYVEQLYTQSIAN
jgi:hypothetical protein